MISFVECGTTTPSPSLPPLTIWDFIIDQADDFIPWPSHPVAPSAGTIDDIAYGLAPKDDDGEIIKEPVKPTCNCIH